VYRNSAVKLVRNSALIGPSQKLQSRFDVPPCRAFFAVSFLGKHSRFVSGYHNGLIAVLIGGR
jgi:hypothetical protein